MRKRGAKPKRMSDIFASPTEQDANAANATIATPTPPYSSDGPTLPAVGIIDENIGGDQGTAKAGNAKSLEPGMKRKASKENESMPHSKRTPTSPHSIHPALYEPWKLLPVELFRVLEAQARLRPTQNIIPIVFSKNQNIKSGINRLKTYLGAYKDPASTIEIPNALQQEDYVIAVSAQGEGTIKLVGILDMVRRIVMPNQKEKIDDQRTKTVYMYTMLTSVEVDRRLKNQDAEKIVAGEQLEMTRNTQEEEAFEPMNIDTEENQNKGYGSGPGLSQKRKVPVLTVWMTSKKILAFKNAFGEQTFIVQKLSLERD